MKKQFIFYTIPDPDQKIMINPDWENDIINLCKHLKLYYGDVDKINLWAYEIGCLSIMVLDVKTMIVQNSYNISIAESSSITIPDIRLEIPADDHIYCEVKLYSDMFNLALYLCRFFGVRPSFSSLGTDVI